MANLSLLKNVRNPFTLASALITLMLALVVGACCAMPTSHAYADEQTNMGNAPLSANQPLAPGVSDLQLSIQSNLDQALNVLFASTTNTKKDIQVTLQYSDTEFFTQKASTYNDKLGYASACLAVAAGNTNLGDGSYANKGSNMNTFLTSIGCQDIQLSPSYSAVPTTVSNIAVGMGHKSIEVNEGGSAVPYELFVVGVRGMGYEAEFATNMRVGSSGDHLGFQEARDTVLAQLLPYLSAHAPKNGKVKVWMSGYSRGAAVANLTAGWLDKWIYERNNGTPYAGYSDSYRQDHTLLASDYNAEQMRNTTRAAFPTTFVDSTVAFSQDDVYCYPVNCPMGVDAQDVEAHKGLTVGVHNLINPDDWIPQVAMTWWNFSRYGQGADHDISGTYATDGALNARDKAMVDTNEAGVKAMIARLKKINDSAAYQTPWFLQYCFSLFKASLVEDSNGSGNKYISKGTALKHNQGRYFEEFGRFLCDSASVPSREVYTTTYQADMEYLLKLFMGMPADKQAQLGTVFKTKLTNALREELKDPELSLDSLGFKAMGLLNMVQKNVPALTRVCENTLKATMTELGVTYNDAQIKSAASTLAKIINGMVVKDTLAFYHLGTLAKNASGIGQAHYPEAALAWWAASGADPADTPTPAPEPPLATKDIYFFDNLDDQKTATDDHVVIEQSIEEGEVIYISDESQPVDEAGNPIDDGVVHYNVPARLGYVFVGWETKADDEGDIEYYSPTDQIYYSDLEEGETELFARWMDAALYTVRYHANTNTGGLAAQSESSDDRTEYYYAENETLTFEPNSFQNGNLVFDGWNTQADGTGVSIPAEGTVSLSALDLPSTDEYHRALGEDPDEDTIEVRMDVTTTDVYAQWKDPNEGTTPASDEASDENADSGSSSQDANSSRTRLAKTGDSLTMQALGLGVVALMAACGIAMVRRARKRS